MSTTIFLQSRIKEMADDLASVSGDIMQIESKQINSFEESSNRIIYFDLSSKIRVFANNQLFCEEIYKNLENAMRFHDSIKENNKNLRYINITALSCNLTEIKTICLDLFIKNHDNVCEVIKQIVPFDLIRSRISELPFKLITMNKESVIIEYKNINLAIADLMTHNMIALNHFEDLQQYADYWQNIENILRKKHNNQIVIEYYIIGVILSI